MKIDRAIVSCDNNPLYHHFWRLVGTAWHNMDINPTIVAIGGYQPEENIGDIRYFPSIEGVPDSFVSQVIRLFLPIYYPNEICITSDIDMLPLSKNYFLKTIEPYSDDKIVIFSSDAYKGQIRYPICYIAAKGAIFSEILALESNDKKGIEKKIKEWYNEGLGWDTDELMFTKILRGWLKFKSNTIFLKRGGWKPTAHRRVDRQNSYINPFLLYFNYYIDIHMQRPFDEKKLHLLIKKVHR